MDSSPTTMIEATKTRFMNPDASQDERIRRLFVALCIIFMVPVVAVFGVRNYLEGNLVEAVLVGTVCTLLVTLFFILTHTSSYTPAVRIVVAILVGILGFELYIGGGRGGAFQWCYLLPVSVPFILGFKEGVVWVTAMLAVMSVLILGNIGYSYPDHIGYRFLAVFSMVTSLSCSMEYLRERYVKQLKEEKEALCKALSEIRMLKGMVPICASCKKIRNDEGFWTQIEHFMKEHSDVEFSHGICPECAGKLFPTNKKNNNGEPKYDV